jgi:hypothetical protein
MARDPYAPRTYTLKVAERAARNLANMHGTAWAVIRVAPGMAGYHYCRREELADYLDAGAKFARTVTPDEEGR